MDLVTSVTRIYNGFVDHERYHHQTKYQHGKGWTQGSNAHENMTCVSPEKNAVLGEHDVTERRKNVRKTTSTHGTCHCHHDTQILHKHDDSDRNEKQSQCQK